MIEYPAYTLSIYGISPNRGFLPDGLPVERLSDSYYLPWESLLANLPSLIRTQTLRNVVDELSQLNSDRLKTEGEWKRAYVVLSFLTHAYIWSGQRPAQRLPPSLSLPFSSVANHFALPATATYAGLNLWNWKPMTPTADITKPENVAVLNTFTGTSDEAWFYLLSVSIEAKGGSIIPDMLEVFEAVRTGNIQAILQCLHNITSCVTELSILLNRMHERCDPEVFYHQIRPFLAGSKGMAGAGLSNGVFYDEGDGQGRWRQYSGGSNAQSSMIQLLDIVLGVEHHASGSVDSTFKANYLLEMRNYMPGTHRHFLAHMSNIANLRQYVGQDDCDVAVKVAYQQAVLSLTAFRDIHIRIATRYIIAPRQRNKSKIISSRCNVADNGFPSKDPACAETYHSGTGGTALMPFLKQTRDETSNAAILG